MLERNVTFSVGLPISLLNEVEEKIDGKKYPSRSAVIKAAVREFLSKKEIVEKKMGV